MKRSFIYHTVFLSTLFAAAVLLWSCDGDEGGQESTNSVESDPGINNDGLGAMDAIDGTAANPDAPDPTSLSQDGVDNDSDSSASPNDDGTAPGEQREVSRLNVLDSLTQQVFVPAIEAFVDEAEALDDAVGVWSVTPTADSLSAAQEAWRSAMRIWQTLEVMQVGAAGNVRFRVAGEGLRDNIYSFPVTNPCKVDQQLASQAYEDANWASTALVNSKGLDALEFLLFRSDLNNQCPDAARINRENTWSDLMANMIELEGRRGALAAVLSNQVEVQARLVAERWSSNNNQFTNALASGAEPFESQQNALDQIFAAFFYVDKVVKDLKLARPAAISPECQEDACPEFVEHRFAAFGKEALIANLEAARLMFVGAEDEGGMGFEDLLILEGASDLASGMLTKLDAAIEAVENIEGHLAAAIMADPAQLVDAHAAVKAFTDDMKSQMVTVLGLRVPQEGAGDND